MTTYRQRELTCPSCSGAVEYNEPMSFNVAGRDTDFRAIAHGINVRELLVTTCARCGFTGVAEDYEDYDDELDEDLKGRLEAEIAPLVRRGRVRPEHRWEYAALLAEWLEVAVGPEPHRESAPTVYLIGELRRRVGDASAARHWFDRAVHLAQQGKETRWVADLAAQQRTAPRERD